MKRLSPILMVILSLHAGSAVAQRVRLSNQAPPEVIQLDKTEGAAPLTIRVVGPPTYVRSASQWHGRNWGWGPGFFIDWNDGSTTPTRGADYISPPETALQHTFNVPGRYVLKAQTYVLGPTDAATTTWRGEAVVNVTGQVSGDIDFRLLSPKADESFSYQRFPKVTWHLHTNRRVTIQLTLLNELNEPVATTFVEGISRNVDSQSAVVSPRRYEAYTDSLRRGLHKFKVRASVADVATGTQLVERLSPEFLMTSEYVSFDRPKALALDATLTARLFFKTFHPDCFSYRIDWGDGSALQSKVTPRVSSSPNNLTEIPFTHAYRKAGTYTIKIWSNSPDTFKNLDEVVYYETATVQVGKVLK